MASGKWSSLIGNSPWLGDLSYKPPFKKGTKLRAAKNGAMHGWMKKGSIHTVATIRRSGSYWRIFLVKDKKCLCSTKSKYCGGWPAYHFDPLPVVGEEK
jgi:hypothetical protein